MRWNLSCRLCVHLSRPCAPWQERNPGLKWHPMSRKLPQQNGWRLVKPATQPWLVNSATGHSQTRPLYFQTLSKGRQNFLMKRLAAKRWPEHWWFASWIQCKLRTWHSTRSALWIHGYLLSFPIHTAHQGSNDLGLSSNVFCAFLPGRVHTVNIICYDHSTNAT